MGVGRRVRGEGPTNAAIAVLGEHPSKYDARTGRVFSGKSGLEMDRYFDGVRLPSRETVYFTSWIKEWCGEDAEYTQADFDRDLPELQAEIRLVQPAVVVCLGRANSRYFLGDVDLEECHAIPYFLPPDSKARELFTHPEQVVVFPCYNPMAGFRNPELSSASAYDFASLEAYLNGDVQPRILYDDPYPEPVYTEITDLQTLDAVMSVGGRIAADTEGWMDAPWSLQISTRPGHAYIVRYAAKEVHSEDSTHPGGVRRRLVERAAEWVNGCPWLYHFVFHSALHDLGMFRVFGIDTRLITFDDTQVMSYNLQLEPLGLKPLCVRWCNMPMDSYESVMGDASTRLALDWLGSVKENEDATYNEKCQAEFDRLTSTQYLDKNGKQKPGRKIKQLPKLSKSPLHKAVERCLRSKDPRKLWADQVLDRHIEARQSYGSIWPATLDHVGLATAIRYAGRDSDGTLRLDPILRERLHAQGLWDVYCADRNTIPLIDRMQHIGIKPDLAHFASLGEDLALEIGTIRQRLEERVSATGFPIPDGGFNANSTYQVGALLFTKFGLPVLKRTSGGDESTNDKILEALEKQPGLDPVVREIIADIRYFRETYKLKHTFVDQIPDFVHRYPHDGRIHASFRITRVVTGRLAASDPNLLAMPKYGKYAVRFREGFVADDGHLLGSWDLSQIELRVLAHLSQDLVLLNAFRTGQDLHAGLAQRIFGRVKKDQSKTDRLAAKAINFGIPMGMTEVGLCVELKKNGVDVNEDDARRWLDETMALYSAVPLYQQDKIAEARRLGFVCDLKGRRRYCGGIRSTDNATRSEAERFAFSTPIQAGAQECMKESEAYIWTDIILPRQRSGQWIEPLIQIHDDVIIEADAAIMLDLNKEMTYAMTQVAKRLLTVPIETSGDWGFSWGHMESFNEA